jgi:hypothetical protein
VNGAENVCKEQASEKANKHCRVVMNWFSVARELQRDWRSDIERLGNLLYQRIPNYAA